MREVRYFIPKFAIISLSALVVRKVTGSEIIGCSVRKTMRKVPGDARRAARGRRKSGEVRGERAQRENEQPALSPCGTISGSINEINNPVNIRLNLCSLQ